MPFNGPAYKQKRTDLGLSQFDVTSRTRRLVAGELDVVGPNDISRYENGHTNPGVENFLRLAIAIGADPLALWTFEGEQA